jgi:murein DD-endopeptidase MepM/ murein hydrolase activator NlpD
LFSDTAHSNIDFSVPIFEEDGFFIQPKKSSKKPKSFGEFKPSAGTYEIHFGDTVQKILTRHGFLLEDLRCFQSEGHFARLPKLMAGDKYLVQRKSHTQTREIRFYSENQKTAMSYWKNAKDCGAEYLSVQWEVQVKTVSGKIHDSVHGSLSPLFQDDIMITHFMDAFRFCCDLKKELLPGAEFQITFEELYDGHIFIRYGNILTTSLQVGDRVVSRRFVKFPGGGSFVGEGLIREKAPLYLPVARFHISSLYQPRRLHPVRKVRRPHLGIDFPLPTGSNVYASLEGRIKSIAKNRASGLHVIIKHSGGFETQYLHLSEVPPELGEGQKVSSGELIGKIGCTGLCTKAHLHFAVKKNGAYVDPMDHLKVYPYPYREHYLAAYSEKPKRSKSKEK